jgi:hypothetical protein
MHRSTTQAMEEFGPASHQGPRSSPRNGSLGSIFQICPERVGDVLKGIEEMSHNVTAGLLTLQLGNMSSNCSFDRQGLAKVCNFINILPWRFGYHMA